MMDKNYNVTLLWQNWLSGASLVASPIGEATLPVKNLLYMRKSNVFRSTSSAQQAIMFSFATTRPCDTAVLHGHNLTAGATVQLLLYTGLSQSGETLINLTSNVVKGQDVIFNFGEVAVRSGQFVILDLSNPDGYVQIARALVAKAWQATLNVSWGLSYARADTTSFTESSWGSRFPQSGSRHTEVSSIAFDFLTREERNTLTEAFDFMGLMMDGYWLFYPLETDKLSIDLRGFFMLRDEVPAVAHRVSGFFGCVFDLIESNGISINDDTRTIVEREVVQGEGVDCQALISQNPALLDEFIKDNPAPCNDYINEHISTICGAWGEAENAEETMYLPSSSRGLILTDFDSDMLFLSKTY